MHVSKVEELSSCTGVQTSNILTLDKI